MGRRVLRRHIWGYSVCLCPIKGTPGLNEIIVFTASIPMSIIPSFVSYKIFDHLKLSQKLQNLFLLTIHYHAIKRTISENNYYFTGDSASHLAKYLRKMYLNCNQDFVHIYSLGQLNAFPDC